MEKNDRFYQAVQMATQNPRKVAKAIIGAGLYEEGQQYVFCQEMFLEISKSNRLVAEEFKQSLAPKIRLVC